MKIVGARVQNKFKKKEEASSIKQKKSIQSDI